MTAKGPKDRKRTKAKKPLIGDSKEVENRLEELLEQDGDPNPQEDNYV